MPTLEQVVRGTLPSQLEIAGSGFVDGHDSVYTIGERMLVDRDSTTLPVDVRSFFDVEPQLAVTVPLPRTGLAPTPMTVTTLGGTSPELVINIANPAAGRLRDIAYDPQSQDIFVVGESEVLRLDSANGSVEQRYALSSRGTFHMALQILPQPLVLGETEVPAGSLLVANGDAFPKRIAVIDPESSEQLAALELSQSIDLSGFVFHPQTGSFFALRGFGGEIVELDPADGSRLTSFNTPISVFSDGGLALDPFSDTLWLASAMRTRSWN